MDLMIGATPYVICMIPAYIAFLIVGIGGLAALFRIGVTVNTNPTTTRA